MTSLQQAFDSRAAGHNHEYDPNTLAVEAARSFILEQITSVSGFERLAIRDALGRVLSVDIIAPCNVPAHDNSAMDGYGMRHADLKTAEETKLAVYATVLAGANHDFQLPPGKAVRIMTGAAIPAGVDTVVQQEVVRTEGNEVFIPAGVRQGQHIRRAGEDLAQGEAALRRGQKIGPAELGLIASLGIAEIDVLRRVRVAFFSTGDELATIGSPLEPGKIYDSNRYTLYGMLNLPACAITDLGVVRDDPAALEAAFLEAAATADLIITSGGVSVGEADFVKTLMAKMGEVLFWKIAMKPGRPLAFGRMGPASSQRAWLFGLPGNPVSAMATFYQFVRPALNKLMGCDPVPPLPLFRVRLRSSIKKAPGRTEFQRGRLSCEDGIWSVTPLPNQGSGILRSMSQADCFIVFPAESNKIEAGSLVDVQPFAGITG